MQMTDSYAAAVAVTIPILALAAGGEARAIRERIQKPHDEWEREYRQYTEQHPLDLGGSTESVIDHLLELPKLPRAFKVERVIALLGAAVWLIVFTLLTVVELLTLQWLADDEPAGHAGLAGLALWSIAIGFAALIVAPLAYLAVPVFLSLDLVPAGLRKTIADQLAEGRGGKDLAKALARETGGAVKRTIQQLEQQEQQKQERKREQEEQKRKRKRKRKHQEPQLLSGSSSAADDSDHRGAPAASAGRMTTISLRDFSSRIKAELADHSGATNQSPEPESDPEPVSPPPPEHA
jgi:hypothetical protein